MKVCVCGGGSLGHVVCSVLSARDGCEVNILTTRAEEWSSSISATDKDGFVYNGTLNKASSSPSDVIPDSDIVLLCLPGFAIEQTLHSIKPFLTKDTYVGGIVSNTGFFFLAQKILDPSSKLFGFQRVPYIARTVSYGTSASLLGYKPVLNLAIENCKSDEEKECFAKEIERLFATPVKVLNNYWEASLTNSNPILHTCRLYSMWNSWNSHSDPYADVVLFYEHWDDASSNLLVACDEEFQLLLTHLPVAPDAIPSLLEYYGCVDATSLTCKLRSIEAFKGIVAPMKRVEHGMGYAPDFKSRYFTEDFPHGLRIIVDVAKSKKIDTPQMRKVLDWGENVLSNQDS